MSNLVSSLTPKTNQRKPHYVCCTSILQYFSQLTIVYSKSFGQDVLTSSNERFEIKAVKGVYDIYQKKSLVSFVATST